MKDRELSVAIQDIANKRHDFKSVRSLYNFAKREASFWKEKKDAVNEVRSVNEPTFNSHTNFDQIVTLIDGWQPNLDTWNDQQFNQQFQQVQQQINTLRSHWLWSGHPYVNTFVECCKDQNKQTATAFLNYVVRNQITNNGNDLNAFNGAMLGYEFTHQNSDLTKRRTSEKKSLGQLRNSYADAQNELFTEVDEIKSGIESWDNQTQEQFSRLYKANKYLGERRIKHHNNKFDEKLREWSSTITELENTYEEKLRLDKPAEYWKKASKKYGLQGSLWTIAIVAMVLLGLVYFQGFFTTWLEGKETAVKLNTIQGVILFGAFAAVYAYLLKVLSRLAFSSFHLMRDAEEREQLTYLYLSLSNESAIDKESRDIVLQALFSRSETGLLANEHGPTMPMSDVLKAVSKGSK